MKKKVEKFWLCITLPLPLRIEPGSHGPLPNKTLIRDVQSEVSILVSLTFGSQCYKCTLVLMYTYVYSARTIKLIFSWSLNFKTTWMQKTLGGGGRGIKNDGKQFGMIFSPCGYDSYIIVIEYFAPPLLPWRHLWATPITTRMHVPFHFFHYVDAYER